MKGFPCRRFSVGFPSAFFALSVALSPTARAANAPPNAQSFYKEAATKFVERDKIGTKLELGKKRELLKSNAAALRLLREGFAFQYRGDSGVEITLTSNHWADVRTFARLLMLESQVAAADKDWNRAADSSLDAMRLGIDLPRGGALLATIVANAAESIGRRALWDVLPQLDAPSAARAALRLQLLESLRPPFVEILLVEKETMWKDFQPILKVGKEGWNEEQARTAIDALIAEETRAAAQPFRVDAAMPDFMKSIENLGADTGPKKIDLQRALFYQSRFGVANSRAHNALLAASLAQRAYVAKNQREPQTLADLVEARLLETIPLDPFSGQPLRSRTVGGKLIIHSVGPDGKDDLGRAIADAKTKNTQANSSGDIVAGRNLR